MKKHLLLIFSFYLSLQITAQNIANGDYENWIPAGGGAYEEPEFWKTTDTLDATSVTKETVTVGSGVAAAKLTTFGKIVPPITVPIPIPAAISNGDIVVNGISFSVIGGKPTGTKWNTFKCLYQYAPVGTDTAWVDIKLFKRNAGTGKRDTVAYAFQKIGKTSTGWDTLSLNLIYVNPNLDPDSSLIFITSSPIVFNAPKIGTILRLDDLKFEGVVGEAPINLSDQVQVMPNPARDWIKFTGIRTPFNHAEISIADLLGRQVKHLTLNAPTDLIDVADLENGWYTLHLQFGNAIVNKKIQLLR
ncbi:MAG: hypothetical protein RIQ89_863 [Bacteroidota bacterium]|jgi:hypothetical protein